MKYLLLAACFFSFTAQAEVSGQWVGSGDWTVQGEGTYCPSMKISFRETANEFRRLGGTFDCGIVVLHSDPLLWERRGNDLYLDGQAAGQIGATSFTTAEPVNDEGTVAHTKFVRSGNEAEYEERWIDAEGREMYLIRGQLRLR